ncbi:E3 ubiquitin-protein ligase XBAT33-like [Nymphaea colorata]|nr:E3 ubiquitin-protein ligase XBAT33-like [Nymphaea colorata]
MLIGLIRGMGNSFGCSASGERLVSAARDGDLIEARMLLELNPCLAKYSTFGGHNSPLHFAAAKGHNEIVNVLLEHGADSNSKNYCGQTALMHACRYGHWEVVQMLLLYKGNVARADYRGRTALHFAASNGHARCMRLLVADFIPSEPYEPATFSETMGESFTRQKYNSALSKFVNWDADGGLTALHVAALHGHFDCVQLLLDISANGSAVTFHNGTSMDLIGAGSTPLHYAACGGNMKCCQVLIAKGASRTARNCDGRLPLDIAVTWGRHWLAPLLAPDSDVIPRMFTPSKFLALPLSSIISIARECGLQSAGDLTDDDDLCAVCLERSCMVAAEGCAHEFCIKCALYLCSTSNIRSGAISPPGSIPCPLCRNGIVSFVKLACSPTKDRKLNHSLHLCTACMLQGHACTASSANDDRSDLRKSCVASVSSNMSCPVSCTPFASFTLPSCTCHSDPECHHDENSGRTPQLPENAPVQQDRIEGPKIGKIGCTKLFRHRRTCHREHQCDLEIGV